MDDNTKRTFLIKANQSSSLKKLFPEKISLLTSLQDNIDIGEGGGGLFRLAKARFFEG